MKADLCVLQWLPEWSSDLRWFPKRCQTLQDFSLQHRRNAALEQPQHHHYGGPLRMFTQRQSGIFTLREEKKNITHNAPTYLEYYNKANLTVSLKSCIYIALILIKYACLFSQWRSIPMWWWWWATAKKRWVLPALFGWCPSVVGGGTVLRLDLGCLVVGSHGRAWGSGRNVPKTLGCLTLPGCCHLQKHVSYISYQFIIQLDVSSGKAKEDDQVFASILWSSQQPQYLVRKVSF